MSLPCKHAVSSTFIISLNRGYHGWETAGTTSAKFWALYSALPPAVRTLADKNYLLLRADPRHPSLHFKRVGQLRAVRVGEHYRALGIDVPEGVHWFWIGTHAEYDRLIR